MNRNALTEKVASLTIDGLNFICINPDGTKELLFTAPDESTMMKVKALIEDVAAGCRISGYQKGYKDGYKVGWIVCGITGSVALTVLLWYLCKKYGKKKD